MRFVKEHGCCICRNPTADAHHLRSIGHPASAALKNGDDFTIPLCRRHHDELHAFGDEKLFLDMNGVDATSLVAQLRAEYKKTCIR